MISPIDLCTRRASSNQWRASSVPEALAYSCLQDYDAVRTELADSLADAVATALDVQPRQHLSMEETLIAADSFDEAALDWLADRRPFLPVPRLVPTRSVMAPPG